LGALVLGKQLEVRDRAARVSLGKFSVLLREHVGIEILGRCFMVSLIHFLAVILHRPYYLNLLMRLVALGQLSLAEGFSRFGSFTLL